MKKVKYFWTYSTEAEESSWPPCTKCPRGSDPFHLISYYIKWVTTSWTYRMKDVKYFWTYSTDTEEPSWLPCTVLGDPEITANLYCDFALYWEGCVICSIYLR